MLLEVASNANRLDYLQARLGEEQRRERLEVPAASRGVVEMRASS
jgi:hypothetical protein